MFLGDWARSFVEPFDLFEGVAELILQELGSVSIIMGFYVKEIKEVNERKEINERSNASTR